MLSVHIQAASKFCRGKVSLPWQIWATVRATVRHRGNYYKGVLVGMSAKSNHYGREKDTDIVCKEALVPRKQ